MINRYNTQEMQDIWNEQYKIDIWKLLSIYYVKELKKDLDDQVFQNLLNISITPDDIILKEKETKHEFLAFLELFLDKAPNDLKQYIHFGLTSSDILDTTFSYQLRDATNVILKAIEKLKESLINKIKLHKTTMMMGRTHGMYAEPISFGLVLLNFYYEFDRSYERLLNCIDSLSYGQLSGPVGNYILCNKEVEANVLKQCKMLPETLSTQVIPRDRYAELFTTLGILASSMERLATEIRQLSQSSIAEVAEGFESTQKGSSSMPHKKNPIGCENICGLARLIRSYSIPAMENIVLWYERDMSHSSNERFLGVDATTLTHYTLNRLTGIIDNLVVFKDQMKNNIKQSYDLFYSQSLMLNLVEKGLSRIVAYKLIQDASFKAVNTKTSLINIILTNISLFEKYLSFEEILKICQFEVFEQKNLNLITQHLKGLNKHE